MLVHCPSCRYAKEVPDDSRGKKVKCSRCGTTFNITGEQPPDPSGPDAVKIILSVLCALLAAGLAVVLLLPEDTTDADRAARLQAKLEQTQSRLSDAEAALTEKNRAATEAVSDLAGAQSMLDAKAASLDKARVEIEALKKELEDLKAGSAPKDNPPEPAIAPAGKPPFPAPSAAPPAEPPAAVKPEVQPGPGTADSGMPASLRKFKRENPDLFRSEVVQTDGGSFPMAVVNNVNQERVEGGGQQLKVTAPPSIPAPATHGANANATPVAPPVQAPAQVRKAIDEQIVNEPAQFPPGVAPATDESPDETKAADVPGESPEEAVATPAEHSSSGQSLDDSVRVVEETINVRQGRTTDSEVVYKLRPGQAIRLGFFKDGWYAVFKPEADIGDEQAALGYAYGELFE